MNINKMNTISFNGFRTPYINIGQIDKCRPCRHCNYNSTCDNVNKDTFGVVDVAKSTHYPFSDEVAISNSKYLAYGLAENRKREKVCRGCVYKTKVGPKLPFTYAEYKAFEAQKFDELTEEKVNQIVDTMEKISAENLGGGLSKALQLLKVTEPEK